MKNLLLFTALVCASLISHAQTTGQRCGDSNPQFCAGETVQYGSYSAQITGIYPNGTYQISGFDSAKSATQLGKTKACGNTIPKFCFNEDVQYGTYAAKIVGIYSNGTYQISGFDSAKSTVQLGKTKACGATIPKFCFNEDVQYGTYAAKIVGIYSNGTYQISGFDSAKSPSQLGKIRSNNPNSVESLNVYLSTDTQDVVQTYQALASVVTQKRAEFLKSSSAYLTQMNSEDVNIFAGMILSKIVRLSTSAAVKENFEKPISAFQKDLEAKNWKSIDQLEANLRTVDFAIRVIGGALKIKMKMAQVSSQDQNTMAQLGKIAAMDRLIAKTAALQEFCNANKVLIEELVQDPRQGAIGMVTADVMQWVLNK